MYYIKSQDRSNNENEIMTDENCETAAEAARAAAEARRRRILESSGDRISQVSGEGGQKEDESQSSGSSRLQAMRRRRYKKAGASDATKTEEAAKEGDTITSSSIKEEGSTEPKEKPQENTVEPETTEALADEEPAKKYVGVAKMRRMKLAEKKKSEHAPQVSDRSTKAAEAVMLKGKIPSYPIYLHLLTTLLMFLVGVDFALQQHGAGTIYTVHRELAPQSIGIGVMNKPLPVMKKPWRVDGGTPADVIDVDEFDVDATGEIRKEPLIDPLFQVDLDELTKGDGFIMVMARFAVTVHRFWTYLFFYLPMNISFALWMLPQRLIASPPMLFIAAVALRLGLKFMGAKLPETSDVEKVEKGDLLSSLKTAATNMVSSNFPTLSTLYVIYRDARADMYILLCGFFVGLAVPLHVTTGVTHEEL